MIRNPAPESTDLGEYTECLRLLFQGHPPVGYLMGKTAMRDALVETTDCSLHEAELLVDQLEARGFVAFEGAPGSRRSPVGRWRFDVAEA
jgi:hypothetical protein